MKSYQPWNPAGFVDTFKRDIMALVERKASQGQLHTVPNPSPSPDASPNASNKASKTSKAVKAVKAETPAPKATSKKRSVPEPHKT